MPVSQHCWVLYCDLICVNYDGNLLDACVTALTAALRNGQSGVCVTFSQLKSNIKMLF